MKKDYLDVITDLLDVEPILINSALVSAQNRNRYYWCNWDVEQPEDKGVFLKDIIQGGIVDRNKSYCLDANYFKGGNPKIYFEKSRRQLVFKDKSQTLLATIYKENAKSMVKRNKLGLLISQVFGEQIYFRKLSPIECERLQTLPDNYTEGVSNTQRYKMLGNGWTVDVIKHLFKELKES